jgi:transposase
MVRQYKRKPGRVDPAKRMARAAELRAEGLSLRQVGERLACDEKTVRNDLARWQRERSNVAPMVRKNTAENSPHRGENSAANSADADPNVISLIDRRKRA